MWYGWGTDSSTDFWDCAKWKSNQPVTSTKWINDRKQPEQNFEAKQKLKMNQVLVVKE